MFCIYSIEEASLFYGILLRLEASLLQKLDDNNFIEFLFTLHLS